MDKTISAYKDIVNSIFCREPNFCAFILVRLGGFGQFIVLSRAVRNLGDKMECAELSLFP